MEKRICGTYCAKYEESEDLNKRYLRLIKTNEYTSVPRALSFHFPLSKSVPLFLQLSLHYIPYINATLTG